MISTKHSFACVLLYLAAQCACTAAQGQAVFAGTWRIDMSKAKFSQKPWIFYTSLGWYHCESCTPETVVQADGQDHAVKDLGVDTESVAIVDQRTLHVVGKKDGKLAFDFVFTVSADGKALILKETDYSMNGEKPSTGETTFRRMGILPTGVHATSGNWIIVKATESENALLTRLKVNGDEITMTDSTGDSYTAKLDGSDATVKGAYGWDAVSLKLINDHTIEETDKFNGKVIAVGRMTVSVSGKTAKAIWTAKPSERTDTYELVKQ